MIKVFLNNKNGFSLLDVMMALGIVTLGLMGIMSLATQNIQAQSTNKNNLLASMLAQEGLELVRNVRDENFWLGNTFSQGLLPDMGITPNTFIIDYNLNIINVGNINNAALYQNAGSGLYSHTASGNNLTPFRRLITTTDHSTYIEVKATVEWTEREQTHSYEAVTNLYNWW